jgi:hypothetical protein
VRYYAATGNFGKFQRHTIWRIGGLFWTPLRRFLASADAIRSWKYIRYGSMAYLTIRGIEKTSPPRSKMVRRNNRPDRLYRRKVQDEIARHLMEQACLTRGEGPRYLKAFQNPSGGLHAIES